MYKIYINEVALILKATSEMTIEDTVRKGSIVIQYTGVKKHLLDYIHIIEKSIKPETCIIHFENFSKLKEDFKSYFTEIKAGGGLVVNEKNEILFIFRRGSWDLPKGKIEPAETKRKATLREVEEETGIKNMDIIQKLIVTRHTYRSNVGRRIIKKSYWYLIKAPKQSLKPQISEDIEKAEWMSLEKFFSKKRPVYPNILEVLHTQMGGQEYMTMKANIKIT